MHGHKKKLLFISCKNARLCVTGALFGGHVRAVFFLITIIFIVCVSATITSFKEIPLSEIKETENYNKLNDKDEEENQFREEQDGLKKENASYGSLNQPEQPADEISPVSCQIFFKL